jgi:type IV secretion system protein TrbI
VSQLAGEPEHGPAPGTHREPSGDGSSRDPRPAPVAGAEHDWPPPPTAPFVVAPPFRPSWPVAKRLNRNALTVAAALAGVTVLTVIIVSRPTRAPDATAAAGASADRVAPPVPARPSFLDQPPRATSGRPGDSAAAPVAGGVAAAGGGQRRAGSDRWGAESNRGAESGVRLPGPPPALDMPDGTVTGDGSGAPASQSVPSARAQAYQAALTSVVMVGDRAPGVGLAPSVPPVSGGAGDVVTSAAQVDSVVSSQATLANTVVRSAPVSAAAIGRRSGTGPGAAAGVMPSSSGGVVRLEGSGSPYTVRAGTLIPGSLLTGVSSDIPGEVLGQTSRDVFDSRTQRILLVPHGSRLIGSYDNRSAASGRLIVAWARLILPDGRSVVLPRLAATDERGQAGLHDQVDHHFGRIYGAALLTSALTAGVQLSQPQQSAVYAPPSSRQVAAGALGQSLADVSLEGAQRGLDVPPTIVIRPGQPFNIFVAGDMEFDGPYSPEPAAAVP